MLFMILYSPGAIQPLILAYEYEMNQDNVIIAINVNTKYKALKLYFIPRNAGMAHVIKN